MSPGKHAAPNAQRGTTKGTSKFVAADASVVAATYPVLENPRILARLVCERIRAARHRYPNDASASLARANSVQPVQLGRVVDIGEGKAMHFGQRRHPRRQLRVGRGEDRTVGEAAMKEYGGVDMSRVCHPRGVNDGQRAIVALLEQRGVALDVEVLATNAAHRCVKTDAGESLLCEEQVFTQRHGQQELVVHGHRKERGLRRERRAKIECHGSEHVRRHFKQRPNELRSDRSIERRSTRFECRTGHECDDSDKLPDIPGARSRATISRRTI